MTTDSLVSQPRVIETLNYKAPFLIEKLQKEQIVESAEEAQALFTEVLRYLVLDTLYPHKKWQMYSRRVDEVWHQFVLFTQQYIEFCVGYFGKLRHHFPSNAPGLPEQPAARDSTTRTLDLRAAIEFRETYERTFGMPLPDLWYDRKSVTLDRRVLIDAPIGELALETSDDMVRIKRAGTSLFAVSKLASPALAFILRARSFYVREIPGELSDEEKLGLVDMLMVAGILVVGS